MESKSTFQRQTAIKLDINLLLKGTYFQGDEQNPNHLIGYNQEEIYRLNLMAIVLNKEHQGAITNILLDDGTGKIVMRSFEQNYKIETLNVGDTILVLGKLRIYNQERYISPEIVKKIDPLWLKVRSLELGKDDFLKEEKSFKKTITEKNEPQEQSIEIKKEQKKEENQKEKVLSLKNLTIDDDKIDNDEDFNEEVFENEDLELLPTEKIINLIKELDLGDGVLIEEIIEKSPLDETEKLLEEMMKKGDIFQNSPGKVKVL